MRLVLLGLIEAMHPSKENQNQVKLKDQRMQNNIQKVSSSPRSDERLKTRMNFSLNSRGIQTYQSAYFSKSAAAGVRRPQLMNDYILHVQVNDIPQSEVNLGAEETNPAERKPTRDTCVKLRDCAMLMDAKPIPNLGEACALILLKAGESPHSHLDGKKDGAFSPTDRNTSSR